LASKQLSSLGLPFLALSKVLRLLLVGCHLSQRLLDAFGKIRAAFARASVDLTSIDSIIARNPSAPIENYELNLGRHDR
jgi:hypothetical protein